MEMDYAEKTTQDFDGPGMVSRVDPVLRMNINADDADDIIFADSQGGGLGNPFQHYSDGPGGAVGDDRASKPDRSKPKTGKTRGDASRSSREKGDRVDRGDRGERVERSEDRRAAEASAYSASASRPKSASRRRDDGGMRGSSEDVYGPRGGRK
jgi:hypothetical protein